jgi:hypothetical protein
MTPQLPVSSTTTPILDLERDIPGKRRTYFRNLLFGFGIGLVVTVLMLDANGFKWPFALQPVALLWRMLRSTLSYWDRQFFMGGLVAIWIAFAVAVVIHELGHFFVGRLVGFALHALQLGPFLIANDHGTLRIRFQPWSGVAGFAAMHVPSFSRLHKKLWRLIFAGPASNAVSAGLAIALLDVRAVAFNAGASSALRLFALVSLFCFFISVLPYRSSSGYLTDGARLKMLLFPNQATRRWYAILGASVQQQAGRRPRNWNRRWLKLASSTSGDSHDALAGTWMAYIAANDAKDEAAAAAYLETCLRSLPSIRSPFRDLLMNEAGVFQSWFRRDAAKANVWFARVEKPARLTPIHRCRTEVAHRFAQGEIDQAYAEWAKGMQLIEGFRDAVQRERLRDGWMEWKQEMEARQASPMAASETLATTP